MWNFGPAEIAVTLGCLVVATWFTMVTVVLLRQPVMGGDFMVFYTFGELARLGEWTMQYDWPAFHRLQMSLVPSSAPYLYPPSYPPLVPALYLPLSYLTFPAAYVAWFAFSTGVYSGLMAVAARAVAPAPRVRLLLGALLFPPFIAHQVLGQSTVWPLIGFVGGWWALTQSRPFTAGLILSLVAIKPHLGMALAIVLVGMRLWRIVGGIVGGLVLQVLLTMVVCGQDAIVGYVTTTIRVLRDSTLINPTDDRHTHALRMSLEALVPHNVATVGWLVASAAFGAILISVWRRNDDWALRVSALLIATLLISPHVQTYDAILLAPASLWLSFSAASSGQRAVLAAVFVLSVTFVVPSARLWQIPASVPLMAWLLWRCQFGPSDRTAR
jgi:hypothetical protein